MMASKKAAPSAKKAAAKKKAAPSAKKAAAKKKAAPSAKKKAAAKKRAPSAKKTAAKKGAAAPAAKKGGAVSVADYLWATSADNLPGDYTVAERRFSEPIVKVLRSAAGAGLFGFGRRVDTGATVMHITKKGRDLEAALVNNKRTAANVKEAAAIGLRW